MVVFHIWLCLSKCLVVGFEFGAGRCVADSLSSIGIDSMQVRTVCLWRRDADSRVHGQTQQADALTNLDPTTSTTPMTCPSSRSKATVGRIDPDAAYRFSADAATDADADADAYLPGLCSQSTYAPVSILPLVSFHFQKNYYSLSDLFIGVT